ncbi:arylesterase [Pseudoalteromonas phenolica]|uniref:Arylesterase n=1 Tax=Pseudoalteromonas phenolica TaxID=161398 RepID=A0A5R9Q6I6_9GAMM|nr:arylesterase [Pseudoalteromonas phenolica]TLX48116.1 arylesterase [Pseudoalteromonas phenolica]
MLREFLKLAVFLAFSLISSTSFAKDKIMIIGDSLSAGYGLEQEQAWVYLLQNKYKQEQSDIEIINTAISGQTTDNAILKIDAWLQAHKPTHVLVELGGNDGIRGFPVKILRKNLTTLVEKSQAAGAKVAVMAIQIPPNLGPRYTKMFADTYKKVTDTTDSYLMPYFMVEIATDKSLMMQDNLHPNAEGQPIIRDFMYREFNTWLKQN